MINSDPWSVLLNQRGGGSIDMSAGSTFGNLPPLDWMPDPGAAHGINGRGQFPWNNSNSYDYFDWYRAVLFERFQEETRRLLLVDFVKPTLILLATKFGEVPLDTITPPRRIVNGIEQELRDFAGYQVWLDVNPFAARSQQRQLQAPPRSAPDWLEQFAPRADPPPQEPAAPSRAPPMALPSDDAPSDREHGRPDPLDLLGWSPGSEPPAAPPTERLPARGRGIDVAQGGGSQPASRWDDAHVAPGWVFPAADPRLIQMVTGYDTGWGPSNFVVNKLLLPWRNALAFAENIPLAALVVFDDAMEHGPLAVEYRELADMVPMAPAMGLAFEVGPALSYAGAWLSTNRRLQATAKGLGTLARLPAYALMSVPSVGGEGEAAATLAPVIESALPSAEQTLPALGRELDSALPTLELPTVAASGRKSPYGTYTNLHASGVGYAGKGGPVRSQLSGRIKERLFNDLHLATDWTPADSEAQQSFDEALRIYELGGAKSLRNYNKLNTGTRIDPELLDDFIKYILERRE